MKLLVSLGNTQSLFHEAVDKVSELLGVKFHPIGAGSSYLSNGMTSTVKSDQASRIKRVLNKQSWKAVVPSLAGKGARTDGVWMASTKDLNTSGDHLVPLVFIGKPEGETVTLLLKTRKPLAT